MNMLKQSHKIAMAGALALGLSGPALANPCGAKKNPCAPKSANPCAAKKRNPCSAKKMNPCAAKKANPCAKKIPAPPNQKCNCPDAVRPVGARRLGRRRQSPIDEEEFR